MGLRFHRSFKLFPGVRLNLSKSALSASFGAPGATFNIGPRRTRSTVSIPGTGLSYVKYGSVGGSDDQGLEPRPAEEANASAGEAAGAAAAANAEHTRLAANSGQRQLGIRLVRSIFRGLTRGR